MNAVLDFASLVTLGIALGAAWLAFGTWPTLAGIGALVALWIASGWMLGSPEKQREQQEKREQFRAWERRWMNGK